MTESRAKHVARREAANARPKGARGGTARKSADERWDQILNAAAEIFAAQGYRTTSLQEIADRVGVLKGSLYYYINSKDELLYEVNRRALNKGLAALDRVDGPETPTLQRLEQFVHAHLKHLTENLAATTVFIHEFRQLPREQLDELPWREYEERFERILLEGQADGSIRAELEAGLTTRAVLGMINSVYRWYRPEHGESAADIAREYSSLVLRGLTSPDSV